MSFVLTHFCVVVTLANSTGACHRKMDLKGNIPAMVIKTVGSSGINEALGNRRCPRSSKNLKNFSRINEPLNASGTTTDSTASAAGDLDLTEFRLHGCLEVGIQWLCL